MGAARILLNNTIFIQEIVPAEHSPLAPLERKIKLVAETNQSHEKKA